MKRSAAIVILLGVVVLALVVRSAPPVAAPEAVLDAPATGSPVATSSVPYFADAVGYYAHPSTPGTYPGVVMIHENRGLRPEIKRAAEELAAKGYHVLAVDLYQGTVMETQEEARAFSSQYDRAVGIENMAAAAAFLRQEGATKLASLGWCFGGAESLALATSPYELDATVVYYGRLTASPEELGNLSAPLLGIFGEADSVVPLETVAAFEETLTQQNLPKEIYRYPGVGHAFANPSNPNFAPAETADAWEKTLAFLATHLK